MAAGMTGLAGLTAASTNANPSAPWAPYWYGGMVTSRPWEVGTLVLANTPPSSPVTAWVKRSLPEPCVSVGKLHVASGFLVALPAAVRQAKLAPPAPGVGRETDPAGPSTVLSWKGWLNRTVPAADALGAGAAIATLTVPMTSSTAVAREVIRWAIREKTIPRPRVQVASSAAGGPPERAPH